jgi:hypothetical protein
MSDDCRRHLQEYRTAAAAAVSHPYIAERVGEMGNLNAHTAVAATRRCDVAPILVAVDGSRAAGAALRIARLLADRDGAHVEAVLLEGIAPSGSASLSAEEVRQSLVPDATRLGRVRRQLCDALEATTWNLHIELGSFGPRSPSVP